MGEKAESGSQEPWAKLKIFFFPLKAMGVTEGFISREVMCVDLKFTKIDPE